MSLAFANSAIHVVDEAGGIPFEPMTRDDRLKIHEVIRSTAASRRSRAVAYPKDVIKSPILFFDISDPGSHDNDD